MTTITYTQIRNAVRKMERLPFFKRLAFLERMDTELASVVYRVHFRREFRRKRAR